MVPTPTSVLHQPAIPSSSMHALHHTLSFCYKDMSKEGKISKKGGPSTSPQGDSTFSQGNQFPLPQVLYILIKSFGSPFFGAHSSHFLEDLMPILAHFYRPTFGYFLFIKEAIWGRPEAYFTKKIVFSFTRNVL